MTARPLIALLSALCATAIAVAEPVDAEQDPIPVPVENPRRHADTDQPEKPGTPDATPAEEAKEEEPPPDPPPPAPDEAALARCETELRALGAVFEREDAIDGPGACGLAASYQVSQIVTGVSLAPATEMRCATALATARWISTVVRPAAHVFGDEVRLTGIRHASTYVCRTRNSQPGAKMSEHALGNAIDIRRFEFDGHDPLEIKPRKRTGSREESFQKAVQAGACLHFTTVLGPGSDAFHDDHIHLDLASRTRGYRLCQ
ncbi:extensin family protein [Oricola sp.]|uniref:extensin-like domain-containing protein n=1 Tax=Oricola sp. TaxID=1979950 RepID=UPI0025E1A233|nr:extensin family protein [Oricola sp.]MCI5074413.1 extensin family protein [Oricola sp.]